MRGEASLRGVTWLVLTLLVGDSGVKLHCEEGEDRRLEMEAVRFLEAASVSAEFSSLKLH